ncbi:sugar ABC transporter permease [Saccharolobus sp.]|uniref:carbohydrate ABC transporter permease n=1 Tax=Saccharolobus sp. TaxID=2100761 RepID=UPI00319E9BB0
MQLLSANLDIFYRLVVDPLYIQALINTAIFIGFGVTLKLVFALLLSGFLAYYSKVKIVKMLGVIYLLPWTIPAISAALSFRWTLDYDYGLLNHLLTDIGLPKIRWLLDYQTAIMSVIIFHIWKWSPMWTLMLFAGRKGIPEELYEAASIDGATLLQRFRYITAPLISKLFFVCLLLSSIWSLGEFEAVWLVTMAGPNQMTHLITTLGFKYTFLDANIGKGLAAYMSLLPLVSVLILLLLLITREEK